MSGGEWYALRVKSSRPDRKSAWLNVYKLTNRGLAEAFLRRHGSAVARPNSGCCCPPTSPPWPIEFYANSTN